MIGDSHAGHLRHGLDQLGKRHGHQILVWTQEGCPPVFGTYKQYGPDARKALANRQHACRGAVERWDAATADGRFDLVVLAARWMWLYEPTTYGDVRIRRDLLLDVDDPRATVEDSRRVFARRLRETAETLTARGSRVLLVSQVPNAGRMLEGCDRVPRLLFDEDDIARRCTPLPPDAILGRLAFTDETIRTIAREVPGASALVPSDHLCSREDGLCRFRHEGIGLYRDENHLNRYGSALLAQRFEASFAAILADRPRVVRASLLARD